MNGMQSLISVNGTRDISHCGKGVTLTKDEGRRLWEALTGIYSRLGGKEGCE